MVLPSYSNKINQNEITPHNIIFKRKQRHLQAWFFADLKHDELLLLLSKCPSHQNPMISIIQFL